LQTDGGLKTGLDVIKAAILGADSFGFGTAPMIALGCKYLRICHLNNCATGVATQNELLRKKSLHRPAEMVVNFFRLVAEETREWLASSACARWKSSIGRTDLLDILEGETAKQRHLDLTPLLGSDHIGRQATVLPGRPRPTVRQRPAAEKMVSGRFADQRPLSGGEFSYARISNYRPQPSAHACPARIARKHGNQGMATRRSPALHGHRGQSFGVWNAGGLHMYLEGDANDYVGKGMAGGKLVLRPPRGAFATQDRCRSSATPALYGATGGELFAAGRRRALRGAQLRCRIAVIEGAGDHCCEYMTGGGVCQLRSVLGSTRTGP
jgi:glutamate synthase (NADPH/NADH) large chain